MQLTRGIHVFKYMCGQTVSISIQRRDKIFEETLHFIDLMKLPPHRQVVSYLGWGEEMVYTVVHKKSPLSISQLHQKLSDSHNYWYLYTRG